MVLSARVIQRPRRYYCCDNCGRVLQAHVYIYGAAERGRKPGPMRLCLRDACVASIAEPKIKAALHAFAETGESEE